MNKTRAYAAQVGHEIIGKLTRRPGWEYHRGEFTGEKIVGGCGAFSVEGGDEAIAGKRGVCIVDAEGAVI